MRSSLVADPTNGASQIVVLGKSLGGAVGVYLAAKNADRIAAAVIENTFTSIEEVAPKVRMHSSCKSYTVCTRTAV